MEQVAIHEGEIDFVHPPLGAVGGLHLVRCGPKEVGPGGIYLERQTCLWVEQRRPRRVLAVLLCLVMDMVDKVGLEVFERGQLFAACVHFDVEVVGEAELPQRQVVEPYRRRAARQPFPVGLKIGLVAVGKQRFQPVYQQRWCGMFGRGAANHAQHGLNGGVLFPVGVEPGSAGEVVAHGAGRLMLPAEVVSGQELGSAEAFAEGSGDDGLHVRLRPFGQLGDERHERAAYFRQAVLDLRRHGRIYFAQAFAGAMKKAYPDLPGADGLEDLAKALYK